LTSIICADEDSARSLENVAEPLAGEPHRGRIDDRHDLVRIVRDHPDEQRLIAVAQRLEHNVLVEIIRQTPHVFQNAAHLLVLRGHGWRQQTLQPERVAFALGESGALVQQRVAQQREAARGRRWGGTTRVLRHWISSGTWGRVRAHGEVCASRGRRV